MKKIGQNINSKKNLKKIDSTAILVLQNGKFYKGFGLGYQGVATGEVCFNTSITGYQEIISDPSYADQIINLLFLMLEMWAQTKKITSRTRYGLKEL